MTEHKMKIRSNMPIPGVAYSSYEVTASGDTEKELGKNYETADKVLTDRLAISKVLVNKEVWLKFLVKKDLSKEFVTWYNNLT